MTEQEYNAAEGVRRSDLWKMEESPEKYKYFSENPVEPTPAMLFGAACHKHVLEPLTFGDEYAVAPNADRRTKAGKAELEAFCTENEGKAVISQDDFATMDAMANALMNCPIASRLLFEKGETEIPFFWTDAETGEKCKVKLDRLTDIDGQLCVVDYKTTASAETEKFNRDIWKLGYHLQAAMYTEGVMRVHELEERPRFIFVAQEKKAPYSVNVIEVTEDVMNYGVAKFHELMEKLHACRETDIWPGYVSDVPNETFVPGWVEMEEED